MSKFDDEKCLLIVCFYDIHNVVLFRRFVSRKVNSIIFQEEKRKLILLSIVKSMSLNGLNGYLVSVQVDVAAGLPQWGIVRSSRY